MAGEFVEDAVLPALQAMNEHKRTNHLHQEGIGQALRIHEAGTCAAREYHRTEVKMGNDQHARSILQRRLQHEEDIDLEKRGSIRENIRDEWMLLSDKAETVFIVNTLVLGTAFAMLIEGSLPDSVTMQMYALTVAYFSALSASVCLLLVSVRFAMILRFRVGSTIVEAMRKAIDVTAEKDAAFRQNQSYRKWNRPKVTVPACGDEWHPASRHVMPYTWHLEQARRSTKQHEKKEDDKDPVDEQTPKFMDAPSVQRPPDLYLRGRGPTDGNQQGAYANLSWLNKDAGFAMEYMLAWRRRHKCKPISDSRESANTDEFDPILHTNGIGSSSLLNAGSSGKLTVYTQSTHDSLNSSDEDLDDVPSRGVSYIFSSDEEPPEAPGSPTVVQEELNRFESEYRKLLRQRQRHNAGLQHTLQQIRDEFCKPWDRMAQLLFFSGTFSLLLASCCLVFGRFGYRQAPIPEGAAAFPAAPLAVAGFCLPISVTLSALVYVEIPLKRFREVHFMTAIARISADSCNPRLSDAAVMKKEVIKRDMTAIHIAKSLIAFMTISFTSFVVVANILGPPAPLAASSGPGQQRQHVSWGGLAGAPTLAKSVFNVTVLSLADGFAWPRFWEPSGASFWSSHDSLLIAGANILVELGLGKDLRVSPKVVRQMPSSSSLVDVCVTPGLHGDELWVATGDSKFSLFVTSGNVLQGSLDALTEAHELFDLSRAAEHTSMHRHTLDCRGAAERGSSVHLWLSANESPWPIIIGAGVNSDSLLNDTGAKSTTCSSASQWPTAWLLTDPDLAHVLQGTSARLPQGVVVESIAIVGANLLLLLSVLDSSDPLVGRAPSQVLAWVDAAGALGWWRKVAQTSRGSHAWRALAVDTQTRRIFLVSAGPDPQVAFSEMPSDW